MSPAQMELMWMSGCAAVMVIVGLIAFVGYLKMKRTAESQDSKLNN